MMYRQMYLEFLLPDINYTIFSFSMIYQRGFAVFIVPFLAD